MPRKKISINEALQVFKDNNLEVFVRPKEREPEVVTEGDSFKGVVKRIGTTTTIIDLYAKHSIGSGGSLQIEEGEKIAVDSACAYYGPGRVAVPTRIAAQLLHADQAARNADNRMLDRTRRSFVVVQKIGPNGNVVNAGVEVDNGFMDGFGSNLSGTHFNTTVL